MLLPRGSCQQCLCPSFSWSTLHAVLLLQGPSHAVQLLRGTCHAQPCRAYVLASHGAFCMQCSFRRDLASSAYVLASHLVCSAALAGHFQCSAALLGTFIAVQLSQALSMQCSSDGHLVMEYLQLCVAFCSATLMHRALTHLSKWHCRKLFWGTLQSKSHRALMHLSKYSTMQFCARDTI